MPDVLTTLQKLPPLCFSTLPSNPCQVIGIKRGEMGYYPIQPEQPTPEAGRERAEYLNALQDPQPTPAQISAMECGSVFGWETPAADPDNDIHTRKQGAGA